MLFLRHCLTTFLPCSLAAALPRAFFFFGEMHTVKSTALRFPLADMFLQNVTWRGCAVAIEVRAVVFKCQKKKRIRALGGGMRAVSSFFKKYTTGITKYGHCIC
jgi:hypothetical protein